MTARAVFPAMLPRAQHKSNPWPMVIDVSAQQPPWHNAGCNALPLTSRPPSLESAEAKRARRSAIEKTSRRKRLEALARMRQEVTRLEQRVAALSTTTSRDVRRGSDKKLLVPMHALQRRYTELVLVTRALEHERVALCNLLQRFRLTPEREAAKGSDDTARRLWVSGRPLCSASFAVQCRALSLDECVRMIRRANYEIETFYAANSSKVTGATFMGWTDRRQVDRDAQTFQYCFTKRFSLKTPEHLLAKAWQVFSRGDKMRAMAFDAAVRTRFEVLQVLSDKLIVIRRSYKFPTMPLLFTSVMIVAWWQTPTGYTLCSRTVRTPELELALGPHESYFDAFHWVRFDRLFDELDEPAGCDVAYGGTVQDQNQVHSRHWLFELVCCVLRWEHACAAPLLLKRL